MHKKGDLEVMREPGKRNWPLLGESRGTIRCVWDGEPIVLFEAPEGRLYAVNSDAKARGYYPPLEWLMVEREQQLGAVVRVRQLWIDAGRALCHADLERARRIIAYANRLTGEAA